MISRFLIYSNLKQFIDISGTFSATGINAESFSIDKEIESGDTNQIQFGILNSMKCRLCKKMFRPIVNNINDQTKKVKFLLKR